MTYRLKQFDDIAPQELEAYIRSVHASTPAAGFLVLLPEAEKGQVEQLQRLFSRLKTPLLGAIFPALLNGDGFQTRGLLLLQFDTMPRHALVDGLGVADLQTLERRVDTLVQALEPGLDIEVETSLLLIFDAMVPKIATVLNGLYLRLANQVHYMGVNAGSETFQPLPCLFDGSRLIEGGVLALLLPRHEGAVLEHDYRPPEELVAATATEQNRIISIDWRPAFEVYRERVKQHFDVEITEENFYQYAVHFPFGIMRADGEVLVRIPVALMEDGSLFCVGEVPEHSVLTLLEAPRADSLDTVEKLTTGLGREPLQDLLLFYCAGRRLHLGEAAAAELNQLQHQMEKTQIAGALSLGEIGSARKGGYPLFHNATLVASRG